MRALGTSATFDHLAEALVGDLVAIAGDAMRAIMLSSLIRARSSNGTMGTRPKWKFEAPDCAARVDPFLVDVCQ